MTNTLVVRALHEPSQGREAAAQQKFKIADLARSEVPGQPLAGMGFQFGAAFGRGDQLY